MRKSILVVLCVAITVGAVYLTVRQLALAQDPPAFQPSVVPTEPVAGNAETPVSAIQGTGGAESASRLAPPTPMGQPQPGLASDPHLGTPPVPESPEMMPSMAGMAPGGGMMGSRPESSFDAWNRQSMAIAEKYRVTMNAKGSTKQLDALKTDLRQVLSRAFRARQEQQRAELKQLQERLAKLEQSLTRREKAEGQIIDRRVEELLDTDRDLRWDPENREAPGGGMNPFGVRTQRRPVTGIDEQAQKPGPNANVFGNVPVPVPGTTPSVLPQPMGGGLKTYDPASPPPLGTALEDDVPPVSPGAVPVGAPPSTPPSGIPADTRPSGAPAEAAPELEPIPLPSSDNNSTHPASRGSVPPSSTIPEAPGLPSAVPLPEVPPRNDDFKPSPLPGTGPLPPSPESPPAPNNSLLDPLAPTAPVPEKSPSDLLGQPTGSTGKPPAHQLATPAKASTLSRTSIIELLKQLETANGLTDLKLKGFVAKGQSDLALAHAREVLEAVRKEVPTQRKLLDLAVRRATLKLNQAKAGADNAEKLNEQKVISAAELKTARDAVDLAQLDLEEAELKRSEYDEIVSFFEEKLGKHLQDAERLQPVPPQNKPAAGANERIDWSKAGLSLIEVRDDKTEEPAVRIEKVAEGSSAKKRGLREGDRVLGLSKWEIRKLGDVEYVLRQLGEDAKTARMLIQRDGATIRVDLELAAPRLDKKE